MERQPLAGSKKCEAGALGVVVPSSTWNLASKSSSVTNLNDLPPEVLEKIIDRLDDQASVLNCRLINSKWKDAANPALENLCLSIWKRWNPRETTTEIPFPKICHIFPFPTRSLYVDARSWKEYKKTNRATKIEMFQLFKLFGNHLTSLWIEGMPLDKVQISLMFKELVNLKALSISKMIVSNQKSEEPADLTAKPPPNLQYLRIIGYDWKDWDLVQWVVDQCSSQLFSLEVKGNYCIDWIDEVPQPSHHLKLASSSLETNPLYLSKLKLWQVNSEFLQHTVKFPLTHLSIKVEDDYEIPRQLPFKDLVTFLNNFSGTLVQLYLDVSVNGRADEDIRFNEFPQLTELFIWFDHHGRDHLTHLHEVFLTKFPNLESLHLLESQKLGTLSSLLRRMEQPKDDLDSFLIQHCFQLCPKLKTVTVNQLVNVRASCEETDELPHTWKRIVPHLYEITVSRDGNQCRKLLQ